MIKNIVYSEELPRWTSGRYKWKESIGHKIGGMYEGNYFEIEIIDYIPKQQRLCITYEDKIYEIATSQFLKCHMGKILGRITSEFKIEIGRVFKDDKRDLVIIDRKTKRKNRIDNKNRKSIENIKYYKYKCNKCGFECGEHYKNQEYKEELWITESSLLNGIGCSCCRNSPQIVVQGINDIPTTAPWMIKYFQGGYNEAKMYSFWSERKIRPTCPDCGRVSSKYIMVGHIYTYKSISCSCGDKIKFPEKFMFSILEQFNLNFKTQFNPKWCTYVSFNNINKIKTGRYDFLLEDVFVDGKQIIIETDGGWHNKDNIMSGIKKEESEYIDFTKDKLALENGYEVIRIDCRKSELEWIKNSIINSKLNGMFDLSIIDWLKCEEFALSNRVKEACELWKNGINNTKEISDIMKLSRGTIINYLKKGSNIKWCDYNSREELMKSCGKNGKSRGKQVEIFKDGISLGVFSSCHELDRESEELFGVRLNYKNISAVCLGKQKTYLGFKFRYSFFNKC